MTVYHIRYTRKHKDVRERIYNNEESFCDFRDKSGGLLSLGDLRGAKRISVCLNCQVLLLAVKDLYPNLLVDGDYPNLDDMDRNAVVLSNIRNSTDGLNFEQTLAFLEKIKKARNSED